VSALDAIAAILLAALVLYALLGGADFGGGIWDLLARGPRAAAQRAAIDRALAPVWEANHVWLILAIVLLFAAFPVGFAAIAIRAHVPLSLALIGIVLRGAAFVFRHYGRGGEAGRRRWGRIFGLASALTPICLGVVVAAAMRDAPPPIARATALAAGFDRLGLAIGGLALALFAFLAATYLTVEAEDAALQGDFRRRALGAAAIAAALVALLGGLGPADAPGFAARLAAAPWVAPYGVVLALGFAGALAALVRRRFHAARLAAIAVVALVVGGWGLAQHPVLFADLTLAAAAAPPATLRVLLPVLGLGAVVLFPSLYLLFRVFKPR
jgi:cytochrome d ubiquinol oxidase subunit II